MSTVKLKTCKLSKVAVESFKPQIQPSILKDNEKQQLMQIFNHGRNEEASFKNGMFFHFLLYFLIVLQCQTPLLLYIYNIIYIKLENIYNAQIKKTVISFRNNNFCLENISASNFPFPHCVVQKFLWNKPGSFKYH